jgi:hypothetical protein
LTSPAHPARYLVCFSPTLVLSFALGLLLTCRVLRETPTTLKNITPPPSPSTAHTRTLIHIRFRAHTLSLSAVSVPSPAASPDPHSGSLFIHYTLAASAPTGPFLLSAIWHNSPGIPPSTIPCPICFYSCTPLCMFFFFAQILTTLIFSLFMARE